MLWVAFSRRMCCSRVCSVRTKPRLPSTSTVSPAMRPGMRRMYLSSAAKNPNDGPPKSSRLPSDWPSPTTMSAPKDAGGSRMPSVSGSAATTSRAPVRLAASARGPRSSTVPRKFGCWMKTAAVSSSTAVASGQRGQVVVHLLLGHARRQVELAPEPYPLRDVGEQLLHRGDADRREHLPAVFFGDGCVLGHGGGWAAGLLAAAYVLTIGG